MDIHNTCLAVAVLSILVSIGVIWTSLTATEDERQELHIRRLLQDLLVNTTGQISPADDHQSVVRAIVPWLVSSTWPLRNYFTSGHFVGMNQYHQKYTHSVLVILTHFHDQGGHFTSCLRETASSLHHGVSPVMTFENRYVWDTSQDGLYQYKDKFKLHYGPAAMSICQGCGQVLLMQDPVHMAIGKYTFCLGHGEDTDPACQLARTPGVTIKDWIIQRKNPVFKSLLFNSDLCSTQTHNSSSKTVRWCEMAHDVFLSNLHSANAAKLLAYVLENLDSWFAMVGLHEKMADSLTMLHHVARLPLFRCPGLCAGKWAESQTVETDKETVEKTFTTTMKPRRLHRLPLFSTGWGYHPALYRSKYRKRKIISQEGYRISRHYITTPSTVTPVTTQCSPPICNSTGWSKAISELDLMVSLGDNNEHALTFHPESQSPVDTNQHTKSLHEKLSADPQVLQALALDLQLYKAVQKLFDFQYRMFFDSKHRA